MDHYSRAYPVFSRIRRFYSRRFQDMLCSLRRFSRDEVAQHRMKGLYKYLGLKKAYGIFDRKWRNVAKVFNLYKNMN